MEALLNRHFRFDGSRSLRLRICQRYVASYLRRPRIFHAQAFQLLNMAFMNLTSVLVKRRVLSNEQAEELARIGGVRIEQAAIERNWAREEDVLKALAAEFGLEFIDLDNFSVDRELLGGFPSGELFRRNMLPLDIRQRVVRVATHDPLDLEGLDELSALSGFVLEAVLACRDQIATQLKENLGVGGGTVRELVARSGDDSEITASNDDEGSLDEESQASSVVKLVNELLLEAIQQRASDIHLEPDENGIDVRYRVDGILRPQPVPPEIHRFRAAIVSRLKIMAKLNIAEKRLPQDGRIKLTVASREIDVRVSVIPMLHGEGIVMRLLDKSRSKFDLSLMDFPTELLTPWNKLIRRPHGMVLVTGPTGSGKTTTLYSSLAEVSSRDIKIITVEDPVEYQLRGVNQIQVQSKIGLTFAAGLRSILRHDPDVILIGEIRDHETASSAVQASLTGHLVLSTLHTNDAASAYTRLIDMGIEPYLVASTLEAVLAQRLVRRLCPACRTSHVPTSDELPKDFPASGRSASFKNPPCLFRHVGCRECHGTGYLGRIAIFELLPSDTELRQLCTRSASAGEIKDYALTQGITTLRQSGWQRVLAGQTSIDEVLRVCANE